MDLSRSTLGKMFPRGNAHHLDALAALAPELCARYQITTPRRWVHFLAQIEAETSGLNLYPARENMNYSPARMLAVFKGRVTAEQAMQLAHKPGAIAEHMYGKGTKVGGWLGNTEPGDGAKFIGRGLLQTTGRDAYAKIGRELGIDLIAHPEKLEDAEIGVRAAFADWNMLKCNPLADSDNITVVTKRVNGGTNGLEMRKAGLARAKAIWGNSMVVAGSLPDPAPSLPATPANDNPTSPIVKPAPPKTITPGDVRRGGSRSMSFIQWIKRLLGISAGAVSFFGATTVTAAKDTAHAVYDILTDPVALAGIGALGIAVCVALLAEHFLLVAAREGRYVPPGWARGLAAAIGNYTGVDPSALGESSSG